MFELKVYNVNCKLKYLYNFYLERIKDPNEIYGHIEYGLRQDDITEIEIRKLLGMDENCFVDDMLLNSFKKTFYGHIILHYYLSIYPFKMVHDDGESISHELEEIENLNPFDNSIIDWFDKDEKRSTIALKCTYNFINSVDYEQKRDSLITYTNNNELADNLFAINPNTNNTLTLSDMSLFVLNMLFDVFYQNTQDRDLTVDCVHRCICEHKKLRTAAIMEYYLINRNAGDSLAADLEKFSTEPEYALDILKYLFDNQQKLSSDNLVSQKQELLKQDSISPNLKLMLLLVNGGYNHGTI